MLVNGRIVHQEHNRLGLGVLVDPEFVQNAVQKILEDNSVGSAFGDLRSDDAVLSHRRDH